MTVPTIGREALKAKMDRGHLPGAINPPPDRLAELAPKVVRDRAAEIVVYCADPT